MQEETPRQEESNGGMAQKTVADQLIAQLIDAGVSRIYGIVGD